MMASDSCLWQQNVDSAVVQLMLAQVAVAACCYATHAPARRVTVVWRGELDRVGIDVGLS